MEAAEEKKQKNYSCDKTCQIVFEKKLQKYSKDFQVKFINDNWCIEILWRTTSQKDQIEVH